MATKKKLLQAAAGSAGGGAAGLNVEQVFSTYLYDGNGDTQVIENGINLGQSYGSGSVEFGGAITDYLRASSAIVLGGDFTIEAWVWAAPNFSGQNQILGSDYLGTGGVNNQVYIQNANKYLGYYDGGSAHLSTSSIPTGEWAHVAITRSGSTLTFYINGTASGTSSSTPTIQLQVIGALTGNQGFEGYMSDVHIVSGTVLYTGNFTPPTSALTAVANTALLACQSSDPFADNSSNSYTMTKNGVVTASTFGPFDAADPGEGGLVWTKSRTGGQNHWLYTTATSGTKGLISNDTATITNYPTYNELSSYNANGFTLGTASNGNQSNLSGEKYASWTFRKAPKFFTCLTYTGTGDTTTQTISHDLGAVPGCIIVKRTDIADNWRVYHRGVDVNGDSQPWTDMLTLNSTNAASDFPVWGDTAPTSTEFTVGYESSVNASGGTYVAYLFAHNDGDGDFGPTGDQDIIKCGSYSGTGTEQEINLGFEPQWIMVKAITNSGEEWAIFDTMRGLPTDGVARYLTASNSGAENWGGDVTDFMEVTPTGFRLPNQSYGWVNGSTQNYIYIAIRRGPMAVPTAATDVFDVNTYNATGVAGNPQTTGFPVDLAIIGQRDATDTWKHGVLTRLTGAVNYLVTSSTSGEQNAGGGINIDNMTGYNFQSGAFNTASPAGMYNLNWKRAPNYFDVVAYSGNGTAGRTVSHNLGVAPEMMWVKSRSNAYTWVVYHKGLNGGTNPEQYYLRLDTTGAEGLASSSFNDTAPTASNFTLGIANSTNGSGNTYIAYLFASLDGVSKVGSFTGDGTSGRQIDCGFSSGARFILIKATSTTGHWLLWDAERGIVTGNDPYLLLNDSSAENTAGDNVDPYSAGFIVNGPGNNASGVDYIFYAIA